MAALKLAVDNTATQTHPRPIQTLYYGSVNAKITDWSRIRRAATPVGAIRASVARIVTGQYYKAVIHGENGAAMYTVRRIGRSIEIDGLFMQWNK